MEIEQMLQLIEARSTTMAMNINAVLSPRVCAEIRRESSPAPTIGSNSPTDGHTPRTPRESGRSSIDNRELSRSLVRLRNLSEPEISHSITIADFEARCEKWRKKANADESFDDILRSKLHEAETEATRLARKSE